jgi:hypothetical protein
MARKPPGTVGSSAGGRRARSVAQVGWAGLLAALVLLGALEIHPGEEHHDPVAGLAGHQDIYFLGASHPGARPHAEEAKAVPRPFCAACLNRLQGSGAHLALAASLSAPLAGLALPPASAVTPLQKSLRPDGARAPPFA